MLNTNLISKNDKILCAVSGGKDSMAMLVEFLRIKDEYNLELFVCHLNHNTRNGDSDNDEQFVKNYCSSLKIPFFSKKIDITNDDKQGFESNARKARYSYFEEVVLDCKATKLATAHNQNDNLETILLNFIRGTGLNGLCGIAEKRRHIIRPLLITSRDKIEDYIDKNNIPFVHDFTNDLDIYTRNKIRHNILPTLLEINPNLLNQSTIMSSLLKQDEITLQSKADLPYTQTGEEITINITDLHEIPENILFRFFTNILNKFNKKITYKHFKELLSVLNSTSPSARLNIFTDIDISRQYDVLLISKNKDEKFDFKKTKDCITIYSNKFTNLDFKCTADYDKIDMQSLFIRHKKQGDKFTFSFGSKSLKKIFIDKKIPQNKRDFVPILEDKNGIIAVCFLGTDSKRIGQNNLEIHFRSNSNEK